MKELALDFQRGDGRWRRALLALAFASALGAGYAVSVYDDLKTRRAAKPPVSAPRPENAEELAFARETLSRMSVPWNSLFGALERSRTDGVLLLSVEPNSESRTLRVTGEAKSYLAALTYVATLSKEDALQKVHLIRHESRGASLAFSISAAWKDAAPTMPAGDLSAFYHYLERGESIDEWLAKLYGIATAKNLQLQQADYRFADSRYGIERYQIVLPLDGSYADIRHFLDAALAEIPILSLDQASFRRRSPSAPRVDTELAITLYVRRR